MAYSEKDRADALLALEVNEGNVNKTATELGIPEATLRNWVAKTYEPEPTSLTEAVNERVVTEREALIERLKILRNSTAEQYEATIADLKPRESAAALIDFTKLIELLEGNATQRVESVWNGETVGEAIERYKQEFESRLGSPAVLEVASTRQGDSESEPITTTGELA